MEKKLFRSRREKVIAGVCGGLAAYFNADPTLVRLIFVVLALLDGVGFLIYFVMILVVPKEKSSFYEDSTDSAGKATAGSEAASVMFGETNTAVVKDRSHWVGVALIAVGVFFLLNKFLPPIRIEYMLAAALIVLGVYVTTRKV